MAHDHAHNAPPSETAMRVKALETLLTEKGLLDPAAIDAIFRFVWAEGREPNAEWPALTAALGVADAGTLIAGEAVKAALKENTDKAVAAGVYGVPTLTIGGESFWGVDGTDFAHAYLADPAILDTAAMKRLAAVPAAAERQR